MNAFAAQPISTTVPHMPLTSLEIGKAGTVAEIKVPPEQRGRILEMGLLVGTKVQLVRFAPGGSCRNQVARLSFNLATQRSRQNSG